MNVRNIIRKSLQMIMVVAALSSCDMMTEDLSDCPTGLYVNFVYDYNIQRADMFKDHVGAVTLYVFDESDKLVAQRTVSGSQLSGYGYNIHFTEQELAPGHQYRLTALALQKDWNKALNTKGAKYRHTELADDDNRNKLAISLDRKASAKPPYFDVSAEAPLDTLWHTLITTQSAAADLPTATRYHLGRDGSVQTNAQETFTLTGGEPAYATVSLIRYTKHLNISLRELDHPESVNHDDYEVFILDANGDADYKNEMIMPTDSLVYSPYAQWTTAFDAGGTTGVERSAHYDLMFNRLTYNADVDKNAVLCIRKKSTGENVATINLPYILSEGRTAYEIYSYQPQEYLDREYDYRLEFFLRGDRWQYLSVCIDVLSWAKRIQYVEL